MGKSSLLMRTKSRLEENGYAVAAIDVAGYLGSPNDADEWYQGLLDEIVRQLGITLEVKASWGSIRGFTPNQRLIQFFREIIDRCSKRVVIFLDEIDSTFKLPYTDDFFVAIRAMYNDRASDERFERITFCLVGVASPNELIKDRRTTPYNIGRTIELQDFDLERDNLSPLLDALGYDASTGNAVLQSVLKWTGGHPYLTVRLCDRLIASKFTTEHQLDRLINKEFASLDHLHSDVHFQQVLRFLGERIEDRTAALALYQDIRKGKRVRDHATAAHLALKLAGIVKSNNLGYLIVRNPIYSRVFTAEWVEKLLQADFAPFEKLLNLLGPDRELAGVEYERLRVKLVAYFRVRGCEFPEDLADQTFDYVSDRIENGEVIHGLPAYCLGVARRVVKENWKQQSRRAQIHSESLLAHDDYEQIDKERLDVCLQKCLQQLPAEERELILMYYKGSKSRIDQRRQLASEFGYTMATLRVRVLRLRERLRICISNCLERPEP